MKKIYKYASIVSGAQIIKENMIFLRNPSTFNDPFDCLIQRTMDDEGRIDKLHEKFIYYKTIEKLYFCLNLFNKNQFKEFTKLYNSLKETIEKDLSLDSISCNKPISSLIKTDNRKFQIELNKIKKQANKELDSTIESIMKDVLITCFSEVNDSILMWSHYADSHRGVCIEFELDQDDFYHKVEYTNKKPITEFNRVFSHLYAVYLLNKPELKNEKYVKDFYKVLFTKSDEWNYEKEVRYITLKSIKNDSVISNDENHFLKAKPTAVYVGCKASGKERDTFVRLAQQRELPIHFMKTSEEFYRIVENTDYKYLSDNPANTNDITLLRLIKEINSALKNELFFAAFCNALIIPAICSKVEIDNSASIEDSYIKWCDMYLPCSQIHRTKNYNNKMIRLSGKEIWNLKNDLLSKGAITSSRSIIFVLQKINSFNMYANVYTHDSVRLNITKFCKDMVDQAQRCYDDKKEIINNMPQIQIEDYDDIYKYININ